MIKHLFLIWGLLAALTAEPVLACTSAVVSGISSAASAVVRDTAATAAVTIPVSAVIAAAAK